MKVIVVANGEVTAGDWWQEACEGAAWVVAADGGAQNALRLGLTPCVVIGDLDSLEPVLRQELTQRGVEFISHSPHKDETDTELALLYAAQHGADEILLLGALGGRLDHALANVFLLAMPQLAAVRITIVAPQCMVSLIRDEACFAGRPGDVLSLLPVGGDVRGITTQGLEYPLCDETLSFGPARGISNVLTESVARVRVREGLLLAIQYHS